MNSQEYRNLQEAYLNVYDEGKVPWNDPKKPLESGHTPAEKNRAKRERTGVEDLSKSPTDKEYARYGDMKSVDDEQSSASKKNKSTHKFSDFPIDNKGKKQTVGQFRRTRGTPKPESRDEKSNLYQSPIHKDDKRTRGGRLDQWKGPNPRNEEIDIYDIILSHLLDEGYAETPEAAERIMGNMSEDWRESIAENVTSGKGRVRNIQPKPPTGPISNSEKQSRIDADNIRIKNAGDEEYAIATSKGLSFSDAQSRRTAAELRLRREIEKSYR